MPNRRNKPTQPFNRDDKETPRPKPSSPVPVGDVGTPKAAKGGTPEGKPSPQPQAGGGDKPKAAKGRRPEGKPSPSPQAGEGGKPEGGRGKSGEGGKPKGGTDFTYNKDGTPSHPFHNRNLARLLFLLRTVVPLCLKPQNRPVYEANGVNTKIELTRDQMCTETKDGKKKVLYANDGKTYNPVDFIWHIGNEIKKLGISIVERCTRGKKVEYPPGASVIAPSDEFVKEQLPKVAQALKELAEQQHKLASIGFYKPLGKGKKVQGKMILGYLRAPPNDPHPERYYSPTLADNLSYLSEELQVVVVAYLKGIADYIGAEYECIVDWGLIIPVYPGKEDSSIEVEGIAGFPPHTDGIAGFQNYPGMVFNIAMGMPFTPEGEENTKYFDYIHLFDRFVHRNTKQIHRMELKQGDVSITSGLSRFFWGHGVPGHRWTQLTLAIKTGPMKFRADMPAYVTTVSREAAAFDFDDSSLASTPDQPSPHSTRLVTSIDHQAAMLAHAG
jgi:hypothetical protein